MVLVCQPGAGDDRLFLFSRRPRTKSFDSFIQVDTLYAFKIPGDSWIDRSKLIKSKSSLKGQVENYVHFSHYFEYNI